MCLLSRCQAGSFSVNLNISKVGENEWMHMKWMQKVSETAAWRYGIIYLKNGRMSKELTRVWNTEQGSFRVLDLGMNQLYNRHGSRETWLTVPAVRWRTLLSFLKYIYACWMQIFWWYLRQAHGCQAGHQTSCCSSTTETWIPNQKSRASSKKCIKNIYSS